MLKVIVTGLVWIGSFVLMLPSDKPTWVGIVAGFATYQVLSYFVYELYQILLDLLKILEKEIDRNE